METSKNIKPVLLTKSNSISDVQFKIELEDLKINLLNDTNTFKKTFSNSITQKNFNKTSKENKEIKIAFDSICNYSIENETQQKKDHHSNHNNSLKTSAN